MAELQDRYRGTRACIDPARLAHRDRGVGTALPALPDLKWPTSATAKNGRALERFATDLRSGSLLHDGDARLRRHVMTA